MNLKARHLNMQVGVKQENSNKNSLEILKSRMEMTE